MKIRKFTVVNVELTNKAPDGKNLFSITYAGIEKKKWIQRKVWIFAKDVLQAKQRAEKRFGGKE